MLIETASVASSLFQNTDEAIVENGSSVAAVVAGDGGRERGRGRKERVFPPSSIDGRTFGVQSQRGNAFVSQTRKGRKEGRKGRGRGRGLDDGDGRFGVRAKSH